MKRLVIYILSGEIKELHSYVPCYLQALTEIAHVVCVGMQELSTDAKETLRRLGVELKAPIQAATCTGLWLETWKQLVLNEHNTYDEVIMCNDRCLGPIFPLKEMFGQMDVFCGDAWSVSMTKGDVSERWEFPGLSPDFLVLRRSLFQRESFISYIRGLKNEPGITEQFVRFIGSEEFSTVSYVPSDAYSDYEGDWLIWCADRLLKENRCPLIKRALFTLPAEKWLENSNGQIPMRVMKYLESGIYDTSLIWDDLLKHEQMSQLRTNLHLNYVVPIEGNSPESSATVALILFVYYEELVDYCMEYALHMPQGSSIFIVSAKESLLATYRSAWNLTGGGDSVEYRLMENRGRDVSAYLVAAADVFYKFNYVCCMHDKKSRHIDTLLGRCFSDHCFENNLASLGFVRNVIDLFVRHPRLGMLVPPTVAFGRYYMTLGTEMGDNEEEVRKAYKTLELTVPYDNEPVAAFGTMFWVRGKAFARMFRYKWSYEDFPAEPLPADGSLLHGLERIYQLAVQEAGYYTAWLSSDVQAGLTMDNWAYMLRHYNTEFFLRIGFADFSACINTLRYMHKPSFLGSVLVRWLYFLKWMRYSLFATISKDKRKKKYQRKAAKYRALQIGFNANEIR